jgi:RNA polymerase sigma-70 factor (ECF subfamily)
VTDFNAAQQEPMDERQAVARLKKGDLSGLDGLVMRYQAQAIHTAYLVVLDIPTAEDVVQEAFLRAFDKIHQFDDSRPFGPWFLRSVVNAALKATRHTRRLSPFDEQDLETGLERLRRWAAPAGDLEQVVESEETRREVWEAINRLSPQQRAVIVMRYFLGLSEAEMVVQLDRPTSTVKWWLWEARRHLRDWFEANGTGQDKGGAGKEDE